MHVLATAGHVDHGKSTLIRALTGMEPDRWAEERRRGMTIDLGFAWTQLPGAGAVAFVDVPGHHRFLANMLAGVGPVPAVLFVVAADEGWRRQSEEHLAALDALGITHGLLVVTRSDLADPAPALEQARARLARSTLAGVETIAVSAATGSGLPQLREALARLAAALPAPDTAADVRVWVDRSFSIAGSGTVVTATLTAGTLHVGQRLQLAGSTVTVRGLQTLGRPVQAATAVARVALNLRGVAVAQVHRGVTLRTPDCWFDTALLDVALQLVGDAEPAAELVAHLGSAAVPARLRLLDANTARVQLREPLPVRVGDRLVLRDPGLAQVVAGARVLDPDPPPLRRRGAARARAVELGAPNVATVGAQVRRRGIVDRNHLRQLGFAVSHAGPPEVVIHAGWLVDPSLWQRWQRRAADELAEHIRLQPDSAGLPAEQLRRRLDVPDLDLLDAVLADTALLARDGVFAPRGHRVVASGPDWPELLRRFAAHPFRAPTRPELQSMRFTEREVSRAVRDGTLLRLAPDAVLERDAPLRAVARLAGLGADFTVAQVRVQLDTTRRVAVPLLELLDERGFTQRVDDERRRLVRSPAGDPASGPAPAPAPDLA